MHFLTFLWELINIYGVFGSYKTRNIASQSCKKGHVKIEDSNCKPSKEIYGGEIISIRKNQMNYKNWSIGYSWKQNWCKIGWPIL